MKSHPTRVVLLALVVALAAGACGGSHSADVTAFCDDYLAVNALMSAGRSEGDRAPWIEELTTGLEDLEAGAPEEVSSAVTALANLVLEPLEAMDQEGFFAATESPEFAENAAVVDEFVVAECGLDSVEVNAVDYAFEGDLDSLQAGEIAFDFNNNGSELQEMALIRINDDTTESLEELLQLPEEEAQSKTTFTGAAFATPGGNDVMYADLEAGRYAIICFIPTGSTSIEDAETADGPPHFVNGMAREFTVEG
jgi:hypothetical protein